MISTTDLTRELLFQIRLGEDSAFEFKRIAVKGKHVEEPHRDSLADELAAFANSAGGMIVLGVSDKPVGGKTREVIGIPHEHLDTVDQWLANIASQAITPPLQK